VVDTTGMNVTAASASAFKQQQVAQEVGVRIAAKTLDVAKQQGAAAISLLESAAEFATAPVASHKGQRLDVSA